MSSAETPSIADYQWLVSDAALSYLDPANQKVAAHTLISRLRKDLTTDRARLVVDQLALRAAAKAKFPAAEKMFFTRRGMEQSTDHWIAAYKANRLNFATNLLDACSGIGGDLIEFAAQTQAIGVDADPAIGILAQANALVVANRSVAVKAELLSTDHVSAADVWHVDPDRRVDGKRTVQVESFSPAIHVLESCLAVNENAAIKLAPASNIPDEWLSRCEREWIGSRGECRQQVLWFGNTTEHHGATTARIVSTDSGADVVVTNSQTLDSLVANPFDAGTTAENVHRYIYEPKSTVLAAELTDHLANETGLLRLNRGIAYLTGDSLVQHGALAGFEVSDVLPFDRKRIKSLLKERGIGRLEIKKRGVDESPEALRKLFRNKGQHAATLILSPFQGKTVAILAQRLT